MSNDLEHLLGASLAGFRLTHLLGAGNAAVVFRGENELRRDVVRTIKIMRPDAAADPERRQRFVEEAAILERIDHPNVVRLHALREGQVEGQALLFMELEYLEGHALSTILLRVGTPPSVDDVVRWMVSACRGVGHAHALGIAHRDLKPDNLFLTSGGTLKVLDFGVARVMDDLARGPALTQRGSSPGTPAYLAPELVDGGSPSTAADVYALGITLCELLLGFHPFDPPGEKRRSSPQMLFAHLHEPLPRLRDHRPDVPASLEAVATRAAAKKRGARFADASALAEALTSIVAGDEVVSREPERSPERSPEKVAPRTEFVVPKMRSTHPPPFAERAPVIAGRGAVTTWTRRVAFVVLVIAFGLAAAHWLQSVPGNPPHP